MEQPIIEVGPRMSARSQACLKVATIAFHPKSPCSPYRTTETNVVANVKQSMNSQRAGR